MSRWGDRIKALRELKGLTQEQLAGSINERGGTMDRSRLSNIETGANENPELVTLRNIAAALDVDIAELFQEPRPDEASGHGEASGVGGASGGVGLGGDSELDRIIERFRVIADRDDPAADSLEGDVLKAAAILNRAVQRIGR